MNTRPDGFQTADGAPNAPPVDSPRLNPAAVQAAVQAYARVAAEAPDFAPHAHAAYEQIATLGQGGMGVVFRMRDRRLGREVALKLIRGEATPRRVARFRREALLTASLEHPAIPPVYEAGTTPDGAPYMVMRLIDGQPLSKLIAEHHQRRARTDQVTRRGERRRLLEALLKVADAVAYAHGAGVIHRDLKPDNVLVGGYGEVLLMDWGLAKRVEEPGDEPETGALTQDGTLLGTPGFVAPEQARGRSDPRSDVFSLGAMLTELLTGRLPTGEGGSASLAALAEGRLATPRQLDPDVPAELDSIAARALAIDPDRRTPSAQAFADSLRAWLAGEDVPEHRYGVLERLARGVRRRPTAAVASLALLLVLGGASLAGVVLTESRRLRLEAESRQRQTQQARELAATAEREANAARAQFERSMTLLAQAEPLLQRGQSEQALALVDQALGAGPPPRALLWHAARVCQAGKAYARARELLEQVIATDPPGLDALYQLHRVEVEERGMVVGADTPSLRRLSQVASQQGENAFSALLAAMEAERAGRLREGLELATRALELNPSLGQAANVRGAIRHRLGDREGAIEDFRLAVTLEPQHFNAWSNLGYLLGEAGRPREGLSAVDRSLAIRPTPGGHNNRGILLYQLGRFDAAIWEYTQVLDAQPKNLNALKNRGNAKLTAGHPREALADYDASVKLQPTFAEGHFGRALAYESLGDLEEADRILSELLRRASQHPRAANWRVVHARVRQALGRGD